MHASNLLPAADRVSLIGHRGTAATEFIIVLPLLLLVALGSLDIGRAVQHYSVMSNAASAGAQYAATNRFFSEYTRNAWESKVREVVQDELTSLAGAGASAAEFEIQIDTATPPPSDDMNQSQPLVRISVTVDYDFPTSFRWPGFPRMIPLHCQAQIRQYR